MRKVKMIVLFLIGFVVATNSLFAGGEQAQTSSPKPSKVIITYGDGQRPVKIYINSGYSASMEPGTSKTLEINNGNATLEIASETGDRSSLTFYAKENVTNVKFSTVAAPVESNVIVRYAKGKKSAEITIWLNGRNAGSLYNLGESKKIPVEDGINAIEITSRKYRSGVIVNAKSNDTVIDFEISKVLKKIKSIKIVESIPQVAYKVAGLAITGTEAMAANSPQTPAASGGAAPQPPQTAATAAASPGDSQAVAAYKRGEAHHRKNAFDEAIAAYSEAIQLDPNYADAYMGRGNAYSSKGDDDKARADYDKAAQIDPKYAGFARAFGSYIDENYDKAIEEYTMAIKNRINLFDAYNNRGVCYYNLGNFDSAIADFTEGIRLRPEFYIMYSNRAHAYYQIEEYDKALADFNTAIRLAPLNVSAHSYVLRGEIYLQKRDNTRAMADFNQAVKLDPKNVWAYYMRCIGYFQSGDLDKAMSDINEAIKLQPDDKYFLNRRATIYEQKREYAKALADYNEILRLDPDNDEAKAGRRRVQAKLSSQ